MCPLPLERAPQIRGARPQDAAALATRGSTPRTAHGLRSGCRSMHRRCSSPKSPVPTPLGSWDGPASADACCRRWSTRSRLDDDGHLYSMVNSRNALSLELHRPFGLEIVKSRRCYASIKFHGGTGVLFVPPGYL